MRAGAGFADHVAVFGQAVRAQGLHDRVAVFGAHLQDHAQLFVEQGFERELFAPCAHLARPVFAIAHVHAAVGHAVALEHQHVHIQGHAHAPGKRHFGHCGQQTAVAAVVVGQDLAVCAQGVDGVHQRHQVLRLVQIGHLVADLVQGLRQDAGGHAVLAVAQVDEHQRGV